MCRNLIGISLLLIGSVGYAADEREELIRHDRWQIEGLWRVVALEVNGQKSDDEDCKKLTVINGNDGSWRLLSEGNEISKGVTTIDPTMKPRTIDVTPTEGSGQGDHWLGIYELGDNTRKLCFVSSDHPRPTDFTSTPGSERILVTFERDSADAIKIDNKRVEGVWQAATLEIDGNKVDEEAAKKFNVVIGIDGSWILNVDGKEVQQGSSLINPANSPKSIDFTPMTGENKGKQSLGIYEVSPISLKICVSPTGRERPDSFQSLPGTQHFLFVFERTKTN
jgi:uncharacterized protein (TIGR03067 family)